jgi:MacB-like protein
MNWLNVGLARIRGVIRREAVLRDVDEELRLHIDLETEANVRRGMSEVDARRAAVKSFGNVGVVKDVAHDIRGGGVLDSVWQDIRFGARMLLKKPGFTAAAVATLALGIGANTTMFSVINSVVLQPLPFPQADRLLLAHWRWDSAAENHSVTGTEYTFWRENSRSLQEVAAYSLSNSGFNLTGGSEAQRVRGLPVSDNFFRALGVRPTLGRDFVAEEDLRNTAPVAIISDGLWRSYFGRDPTVVGKEVQTLSVERLAQLVVRAITRFDRADLSAKKAILLGIFAEVFFRDEAITAFRFAPTFIAELGQGTTASTETIHLDQPFRLREPVPAGHKRCTCCQESRPFSDFYQKRAQCRGCFNGKLQRAKRARSGQKSRQGPP